MSQATQLIVASPAGRRVLLATILASGAAFLDSSVVNVALPRLGADLGGGFATLQWVLDAYLLTLGALVLVGGALGDLLGRRRVFLAGLVGFGVTSVACGLAPNAATLIAFRGLQGVAAALLIPGSLAIVSATFAAGDRGRAIGLWSGLSGVSAAIGPFVGGVLVDAAPSGWRWIFLLNVPLVVAAGWATLRGVPDLPGHRSDAPLRTQLDLLGATLTVVGLGLVVGPLIEVASLSTVVVVGLVAVGMGCLGLFVLVEHRRGRSRQPPPMLPLSLFNVRSFTVANVVTLGVYAALGGAFFLFSVQLQLVLGWSALAAGAAGLPITLGLAAFSGRVGGLIPRWGARWLLTAGSVVTGLGLWAMGTISAGDSYPVHVLPPVLLFTAGLVLVVAPVTSSALGDVPNADTGAASGVNNAVARIGGLLAIAVLPLIAGTAGLSGPAQVGALAAGYQRAMLAAAALCWLGAVVTAVWLPRGTGRSEPSGSPTAAS